MMSTYPEEWAEHSESLLRTLMRVCAADPPDVDIPGLPIPALDLTRENLLPPTGYRNSDTFTAHSQAEVDELIRIAKLIDYVGSEFEVETYRPPMVIRVDLDVLSLFESYLLHALDFYLDVRQRELAEALIRSGQQDDRVRVSLDDLVAHAIYVETEREMRQEISEALATVIEGVGLRPFNGAEWRTETLQPVFNQLLADLRTKFSDNADIDGEASPTIDLSTYNQDQGTER